MRLLSDPLPLRVAADLPRYRTEAAARVLPWVYGRVTLSPVPLDDAGLEWLVADHPVVAVEAVRSAGKALDGWQLVQRLDETGRAIATVRLTRAPEAELAVQVVGRRDDTSGALLEHPARSPGDGLSAVPAGRGQPADRVHEPGRRDRRSDRNCRCGEGGVTWEPLCNLLRQCRLPRWRFGRRQSMSHASSVLRSWNVWR